MLGRDPRANNQIKRNAPVLRLAAHTTKPPLAITCSRLVQCGVQESRERLAIADSVEAGGDSYGNADVIPRGGGRDKTEAGRRVHRYAAYANKYESVELGSRMIYVQKSRTLPSKSCKRSFRPKY